MHEPLPGSETVRHDLQPVLNAAIAAIAAGVKHVRAYADWQDQPIDRTLAPALVRHETKVHLRETGQQVTEEEVIECADDAAQPPLTLAPVPFASVPLSNNGLLLEAGRYRVRILKSDQGALPPPGPSPRRREFYAQQQELPFYVTVSGNDQAVEVADAANAPQVNLVLHWTVDAEYRLTKINLALPKGGANTRASVEWEWDDVIWRPAPVIAATEQATVEAPADELDITLETETKTGTAQGGTDE